tara:strand:+ start:101 stop:349 length:249 start_codon:yes stop_codon:yes gene_type:complete
LTDPIVRGTPPASQVSQVNPISRLENNRANPVIKQGSPANSLAINQGNPDRVANPAGRVVAANPEAINLTGKAVRLNRRWKP